MRSLAPRRSDDAQASRWRNCSDSDSRSVMSRPIATSLPIAGSSSALVTMNSASRRRPSGVTIVTSMGPWTPGRGRRMGDGLHVEVVVGVLGEQGEDALAEQLLGGPPEGVAHGRPEAGDGAVGVEQDDGVGKRADQVAGGDAGGQLGGPGRSCDGHPDGRSGFAGDLDEAVDHGVVVGEAREHDLVGAGRQGHAAAEQRVEERGVRGSLVVRASA